MEQGFFYIDGIPTKGIWVDLESVTGWDDVYEALADADLIPRDEDGEPEYGGDVLCACTEGDLAKYFLSPYDTFDLEAFMDCFEHEGDDDAKAAFMECFGDWDASHFEERYRGRWDSWENMAEELLEETGDLSRIPENLRYYFDYEKYARDLRIGGDMCEHDNHFFWNF